MKVVYILLLVTVFLVTIPLAILSRIYETFYSLSLFLASKIDD